MCAIAGQVGFSGQLAQNDEALYRKMLESMRQRGPDQWGSYMDACAALLHARLCVIDPEGGRQPMRLEWRGEIYVLIYNGELYNAGELRCSLEPLGHVFAGHSDTEVLLHAYAEWGEKCLERLNGIYAFAVWESIRQRLFLARDRIGVKPLFFALGEMGLLFASEIKTLLCHPAVRPRLNREGLMEIMLIGPGRTPGCGVFEGVEELRPGHFGYFDRDGLRIAPYWSLREEEHCESFEETAEHVRFLLEDSVRRQLASDVPVCAFLSGGLDSSLICALAQPELAARGEQLQTFSVDYAENDRYFTAGKFQPEQDAAYVEIMNRALGAPHHRVLLETEPLADALYDAVDARDLPGMADVDASLLLLCREMKKTATVGLSGECADELFGGYPWYRDPEIRARQGFPWAQSTAWRASFLPEALRGEAEDYVAARYGETVAMAQPLDGDSGVDRRMREMYHLNFHWFMQTLLDRKDRMSMASGFEVRVPFCDHRLAEYLYNVPWAFKDRDGHEKGLLRHAMAGVLPEQVLWRKKSPYPKTHHPAYLALVSERLRRVLADPNAPILEITDREALHGLLTAERTTPWYGQLMTIPQTIAYMLQVNYWLEKYRVEIV